MILHERTLESLRKLMDFVLLKAQEYQHHRKGAKTGTMRPHIQEAANSRRILSKTIIAGKKTFLPNCFYMKRVSTGDVNDVHEQTL